VSTVAIVDDALIIRMQMKRFFEETMKFEVVAQGGDGNEAIKIFRESSPDLMTLDLTMPNKNGIEALREILQFAPAARVIVLSAIKDKAMIDEALALGAKGFISKPLQFNSPDYIAELKQQIAKIVAS
jgi:two-component system chemotaxis response regulator CheY